MSWRQEWQALATRIDGLLASGDLYFASIPNVGCDYYAVSNTYLLPAARSVRDDLNKYLSSYREVLPIRARDTLERHLKNSESLTSCTDGIPGVQGFLIFLAVFRAEFGHAMEDAPARARSLVTRAFVHLQRLIVTDTRVRDVWQDAFNHGELALEKLGGTHLLSFGIWAFKCSAIGERTDLVLGERLDVSEEVESAAEALVLTEWKCVRSEAGGDAKFAEGLKQAQLYAKGILAGFELAADRYIVLISKTRLSNLPPTSIVGDVCYHVINVAVSPDVPSREAHRQLVRS